MVNIAKRASDKPQVKVVRSSDGDLGWRIRDAADVGKRSAAIKIGKIYGISDLDLANNADYQKSLRAIRQVLKESLNARGKHPGKKPARVGVALRTKAAAKRASLVGDITD